MPALRAAALYSLRMQNAVIIKLAVQDMFNAVAASAMLEINEDDYVDLMRDKVEEFRLLFVEWIRGFDATNDLPDGWGIRYGTSSPEEDKLLELMFDEDRFNEDFDDDFFDDDEEDRPDNLGRRRSALELLQKSV